jgi:Na+-driven multidrug efflux pump
MGAANRVAVNTGILYARMAITVFISLYATRLVLDALGAEDYGIFNVVGGAIGMLSFLNAAMAGATQRFMSYAHGQGDEDKQKTIFNVSILLHLIIAFIMVLLLEGAGYFLFGGILKIDPDRLKVAKLIYHFLVFSTFIKVISVPYDAVINAHENMLFVAIIGIIEAIGKLSIALYVTNTGMDRLGSYGFLMAALAVFLMLVLRVYCHKKYDEVSINIRKYYDKMLFKEMTGYAGWTLLNSFASLVSMQGITIVLNSFFGVIVNAAQGVANQISGQLMVFSNTMLKALNPVIDKSEGGKNREKMINFALTGTKFSFLLFSFFAVPFILEAKYILNLWLKDVPPWAILFCRLEIIRNLIEQLFFAVQSGIRAEGRIRNFSIYKSISYALPLPISIILFSLGFPPYFSYISLIVCWSIGGLFIVVYFAYKNLDLSIVKYVKNVLSPSLTLFSITSFVGVLPFFVMESSFLRLILVGIFTSISFLLSFWFVAINLKEKELILKMLERLREKFNESFWSKLLKTH